MGCMAIQNIVRWSSVRTSLAGLALSVVAAAAPAQGWVPNETLVSRTADLLDPEFSQSLAMAVWGDEIGRLWVVRVDRDTGDFIPADGRGILIDPDAQTYGDAQKTYNGPEWVSTVAGEQIVYTKFDGYHTGANARLAWAFQAPDGGWVANFLGPALSRLGPYGSKTANDAAPLISYIDNRDNHFVRELWNPDSEQAVPEMPASAQPLRFAIGARAVTFTRPVDGVEQAFVRDVDTGVVTQLTFDATSKREVWMWRAPEFGDELVLSMLVNDVELHVYRLLPDAGGSQSWQAIHRVSLPTGWSMWSPEPFTYNGKSYLVMAVQLPGNNFKSEIWVTNIDASAKMFRRITDNTTLRARTDPEVFITTKGPMIYYNRLANKGTRKPRGCIKVHCSEGVYRADPGLGAN